MAYSKSRARIDFNNGSKVLQQLSKKISYKSSSLSYDHKLLIYQSSIFLMSAKIEEYTKMLIEDLIYSYKINKALMSEIPENMKTKILIDYQLDSYKNYNHQSDERKLLKRVSCTQEYYKILDPNSSDISNIKSHNILATNKYPSIKNLRILYFRVGIKDIFQEIQKRGKTDFENKLMSFLSVREAIAHQQAPSLTIADIERHIENLKDIINNIDRVVYSHICSISGEKYWKSLSSTS